MLRISVQVSSSYRRNGFFSATRCICEEALYTMIALGQLRTLAAMWCGIAVQTHAVQGSFRGGTRGNGIPIVKVFKNAQNSSQVEKIIKTAPQTHNCIWRPILLREDEGKGGEGRGGRRAFPLFLFYETTTDAVSSWNQLPCVLLAQDYLY